MLLFVPYEIETLKQVHPWANWLLVGLCTLVSLVFFAGGISEEALDAMVLYGWNPSGLLAG